MTSPNPSRGEMLTDDQFSLLSLDLTRDHWRMVVQFGFDEFGGFVAEDDNGAVLYWSDFVANDWTEPFPTAAQALGRLALLVDASRRGAFFTNSPEGFATTMQEFFDREAQ